MNTELKIIKLESKTVEGNTYNLIKAWTPKGFSQVKYQEQVESYGGELIHIKKLSGDKAGNVYDIIVCVS